MDYYGWGTYLGAGGLVTLAGLLLKFVLDRRRLNADILKEQQSRDLIADQVASDFVKSELLRLQEGMRLLEERYHDCIQGEAQRERKIGNLEGKIKSLEIAMDRLGSNDIRQATNAAADRAASQAVGKVEAVVEQAAEKAADKAVEKVQQHKEENK